MPQEKLALSGPVSIEELKELAATPGPCITMVVPLHPEDTRQGSLELKKCLQQAGEVLDKRGVPLKQRRELLEPVQGIADEIATPGENKSVVVLRSGGVFRHFSVPQELEPGVMVADHFYLLPLLQIMHESQPFYILALAQKHIRLLRCTNTTSEEIELPEFIPKSKEEAVESDRPDHTQDNMATGGPSTGSMKGVMFTTNTDREHNDEWLRIFYRDVDRGICELTRAHPLPLVIAGVEYEIAMYSKLSNYPALVDEAVRGAPDSLKGGELHKRALEVIEQYRHKDRDEALAAYERLGGSERTSVSLKEIVKAAFDGRVLHLFVAQNAKHMGNFDEMTHKVRTHAEQHSGDEDLINATAMQTIAHAGDVFVVPRSKVPHGSQMAATMRY